MNRLPIAQASAPARVRASAAFVLDGSGSSDPDLDPLSFNWSQVGGPGVASFARSQPAPTVSAPPLPGAVLAFRLAVTDAALETTTANATVSVNRPPVAVVTGPVAVPRGAPVTLLGAGSTDGDGDPLVYTWSQVSGPPVTFATATANTSFTAPALAGQVVTLRLDAADGLESTSATHSVRTNTPPVPSAGADRRVAAGAAVVLDGQASSDADGDPLTYAWTQLAGLPVVLAGAATPLASFTAPVTTGAVLDFRLTTSDGVQAASDDVSVRVNVPPVARATGQAVVRPGDVITLSGVTSSDGDGDPLTYLWSQTGGPPVTFATTTASTTCTAPAARGALLAFNLRVSDGVQSTSAALACRVNRLPEAHLAAESVVVAPGGTAQLDARATDADSDALTYTWTQTAGPPVTFDIRSPGPALGLGGLPRGTRLAFALRVSDGLEFADVTARVRVNQAPVASAPAQVTATPSERVVVSAGASADPDGDALTYTWRQTGGPAVSFDATAAALAFTAPAVGRQSLTFAVDVSDGTETATAAVQVDLSDRTYDAGLSAGGGAGGCRAAPPGAKNDPSALAGIWLMTVFLALRRRSGALARLTRAVPFLDLLEKQKY